VDQLPDLVPNSRSFLNYSMGIATPVRLSLKGNNVNSRGWNPRDRFRIPPTLRGSNPLQTVQAGGSTPLGSLCRAAGPVGFTHGYSRQSPSGINDPNLEAPIE